MSTRKHKSMKQNVGYTCNVNLTRGELGHHTGRTEPPLGGGGLSHHLGRTEPPLGEDLTITWGGMSHHLGRTEPPNGEN